MRAFRITEVRTSHFGPNEHVRFRPMYRASARTVIMFLGSKIKKIKKFGINGGFDTISMSTFDALNHFKTKTEFIYRSINIVNLHTLVIKINSRLRPACSGVPITHEPVELRACCTRPMQRAIPLNLPRLSLESAPVLHE